MAALRRGQRQVNEWWRMTSGRLRFIVLATFGAGVLALGVPGAMAVHDLGFQLDGDISSTTSTPCHTPSLSTCPAPATIAPDGFDWSDFFTTGTTTDAAGNSSQGGVPSPVLPDPSRPGFERSTFI